jgi:hypothetical protein
MARLLPANLLTVALIAAHPAYCPAQTSAAGPAKSRPSTEILVTSLEDYSPNQQPIPGTLRFAIERGVRPCVIRFAVSGSILLKTHLTIVAPFIAIDGSTAPGDGITICRWQVVVANTHNVILRHLRFRCGDGWPSEAQLIREHGEGGQRSFLVIGDKPKPVHNVLVEHCSIQNSTDDNGSVWNNCRNIVFRYCIFSGGHGKTSKAFLAGSEPTRPRPDYPDWLTLDRCLFSDTWGRVPDISGGICHLTNNVIVAPIQGGKFSHAKANIIANYLISKRNHPWTRPDRVLVGLPETLREDSLFVSDNYLDGRRCIDLKTIGVVNQGETFLPAQILRKQPWPGAPSTKPAPQNLKDVLQNAGCTLPRRDSHDLQLIERISRLAGL